jgi:arginine/lysine/ornithine decarboxylase
MVSLEYIGADPPGIPLVVPGEVITRELLEEIKGLERAGIYVKTSGRCYPKVKVIK